MIWQVLYMMGSVVFGAFTVTLGALAFTASQRRRKR